MKEQLLALAYEKQDEVYACSEHEDFEAIIYLIEAGVISTFEELAKYGFEK